MVGEGRKVLRNLQRVAKLFVTKSVFAVVLIISIGLTDIEYPLLPRHLSLAAAVTIGIPAFFLALAPSAGRWRPATFLRDVAGFAIPGGVAAAVAVLASYLVAVRAVGLPVIDGRTVATSVLVAVGLYLVYALEQGPTGRRRLAGGLCILLACGYVGTVVLPPVRRFFALGAPDFDVVALTVAGSALGVALARTGLRRADRLVPNRPS
jgi:cation-transporting P-type ATPase E